MNKILLNVDITLLKREVDRIPLANRLITGKERADKPSIVQFLVSYYGYDILRERSIRHAVLAAIPQDILIEMAKRMHLPKRNSAYDSALVLSGGNWNRSSKLPHLLDKAIYDVYKLRVPLEYMPDYQYIRPPRWADIVAENLPVLFDYQNELSNRIIKNLQNIGSRAMLQMPTGSGKTRTVMHAIIHCEAIKHIADKSYIIWLAHTEELCEQAIDTFKRSWIEYGNGVLRYYRLFGNRDISEMELNGGMLFSSLQKLYSLMKRGSSEYEIISRNCELLIFDEAHKALAPTYKELLASILTNSPKASLIGLSATPGRSALEGSENRRLAKLFGDNLIRYTSKDGNSIEKLRKMGVLASLVRKEIMGIQDFQITSRENSHVKRFMDLPPSVLKRIGENKERNVAIVNEVCEQVEIGSKCLLFACSVQHAKILAAMIGLKGVAASSVTSDMRKATRAKIIRNFRDGNIMAITNYGILSTGYDAPGIGSIIITRPTGSIILYSQMIGRGLRGPRVGGNQSCILVDVIDNIKGFGELEDVYNHFLGYWN